MWESPGSKESPPPPPRLHGSDAQVIAGDRVNFAWCLAQRPWVACTTAQSYGQTSNPTPCLRP